MNTDKEVKIVTMTDNLNCEAMVGENELTLYAWGSLKDLDSIVLSFEQAKLLVKVMNNTMKETLKEEKK